MDKKKFGLKIFGLGLVIFGVIQLNSNNNPLLVSGAALFIILGLYIVVNSDEVSLREIKEDPGYN